MWSRAGTVMARRRPISWCPGAGAFCNRALDLDWTNVGAMVGVAFAFCSSSFAQSRNPKAMTEVTNQPAHEPLSRFAYTSQPLRRELPPHCFAN
jgi:hypothetical protein